MIPRSPPQCRTFRTKVPLPVCRSMAGRLKGQVVLGTNGLFGSFRELRAGSRRESRRSCEGSKEGFNQDQDSRGGCSRRLRLGCSGCSCLRWTACHRSCQRQWFIEQPFAPPAHMRVVSGLSFSDWPSAASAHGCPHKLGYYLDQSRGLEQEQF